MRGVQRLASVSTLQGYRWRNLRHDGMLKVIAGLTSLTEVARVTNE